MQEAKCQQVNPKNTYDSHIMHLEINDRKKYKTQERKWKKDNTTLPAEKSFTFV
jgi:hypothetical protein